MTQTDKAKFRHLSDGAHSWYSLVRQRGSGPDVVLLAFSAYFLEL